MSNNLRAEAASVSCVVSHVSCLDTEYSSSEKKDASTTIYDPVFSGLHYFSSMLIGQQRTSLPLIGRSLTDIPNNLVNPHLHALFVFFVVRSHNLFKLPSFVLNKHRIHVLKVYDVSISFP